MGAEMKSAKSLRFAASCGEQALNSEPLLSITEGL